MRERRGAYRGFVGKSGRKNHLENLGIDGRVKFQWIFRKWDGGKDWIDLAQNMYRWRALVNAFLPPNVIYICRTAPLTSRRYILYISSTNIRTEYFKHAA
jgi:hypothetical protein